MTVVTVTVVTVTVVIFVTVVIVTVATVVIVTYFSKNNLTPRQRMRYSQGSFSRFSRCFVLHCYRRLPSDGIIIYPLSREQLLVMTIVRDRADSRGRKGASKRPASSPPHPDKKAGGKI